MKRTPLISIITVVFNGEQHLQQTINSIKHQTYRNIEYIVIDGDSNDGTLDIIRKDSSISKYISEPDKGIYDAMNKGLNMATGELIAILNSDDWYEPEAVEIVVNEYLKNLDKKIFHADRYDVSDNGIKRIFKFNPSEFKFKYYSMTYSHPAMFIHESIYETRKYNTEFHSISDYQFVLEAFLSDKEVFHYIEKPITNFRLGGTSGQLTLKNLIKENFKARRNAGMNYFQCLLFLILRTSGEILKKFKNHLKNKN